MANQFYDNIRNLALGDDSAAHTMSDMDTDTLRASLIDSGVYTLNVSTHQDEADLSGVVTNGEATLTNVTVGSTGVGQVDCDDIAWTSVSGSSAELIVVFEDTGTAATSPLICVFDTSNTGLPITPSGGNITAVVGSYLFGF